MYTATPFYPVSLRSIIYYPPINAQVDLPSGLFLQFFPTRILYLFTRFPMHATFPAHPILLDLITVTMICEVYKL